jgi:YqxM protein
MINGGEKDMKVPSTYVLYYKERGSAPNQKVRGVEIISGDIPALKSGQSMNLTVMPETKQKQGTYKFMAYRNPDHKGELWGSEINVSENEISACPQW